MAGTGREAELRQRAGKLRAEAVQSRLVDGFGQDQAIVLVGPDGLLAAALAAHHDQAGLVAHFVRAQQVEQFGEQAAVEVRQDFRDHLELHALAT